MNSPPRSLRLGFAGTSGFAVAALDALARSRHAVCAVFTKADRPAGRGRAVHASPVKARALELGLEVHQPESFKSPPVHDLLRALDLDALIVVAYGLILPPDALAIPRFGCLNVHASLLPRWRGAAPIQRAILAADPVTGVTIMHMDAGLDTGPILAARAVDIAPADTAGTLHDRLAVQGGELLCETLDALALGRAVETPQPSNGVTYAEKIRKSEASIDWREEAATVLVKVRAFNPVPVAETRLDALQLRIWEAELAPGLSAQPAAGVAPGMVLGADPGGIDVACGRGVLRVLKLQLAGRKPLAAGEFIKAQRLVGARFTAA